jgi:hypothetical protein
MLRRPAYTPTWDGPIKNWAGTFIASNRWRCDVIHDFEDLLQEAWVLFDKLSKYYPVDTPQHFMALFKRALSNSFHDHARYTMRKRNYRNSYEGIKFSRRILGEATNNGYLNALIAETSDNVRNALAAFDDPVTCAALRMRGRKRGKMREHENLNGRLRRVTGAPEGCDLVKGIKRLLAK